MEVESFREDKRKNTELRPFSNLIIYNVNQI